MVDFNCISERLWPWAACTLLESLLNWGPPILAFVGVFVYHCFTGYTFPDDQKVPKGTCDNLGPDAGMYLEKTGYLKSERHLKWWWTLTAITLPMHVYAAYLALGLCGKWIVWAFNWHIRDEDWGYQFVKPLVLILYHSGTNTDQATDLLALEL